MFKLERFGRFLGHLLAHAPKWYLAVPLLATFGIFCFGMIVDGADYSVMYENTSRPFFRPSMVGYVLLYGNTVGLSIIAVHLVSSYFKTRQRATDTLTLPASHVERFTALLLAVFLVIPLFGILSAMVSFGLLKLFSLFGVYPYWSWMSNKFAFSVVIYLALALPFFALSFLRPKHTLLWGLGVGLVFGLGVAAIINGSPDFIDTQQVDLSAYTDQFPTGEDLFGEHYIQNIYEHPVNPFFHFPNKIEWFIIWLLGAVMLLFSSAWVALKNRQI